MTMKRCLVNVSLISITLVRSFTVMFLDILNAFMLSAKMGGQHYFMQPKMVMQHLSV